MAMDLTGINNVNEYYTHHYLASVFESNVSETISAWRTKASESDKLRTPWSLLRDCAQHYYVLHDKSKRARNKAQILPYISEMASRYLTALGYPEASPFTVPLDDNIAVFPFLEMKRANGAPLLWVLLSLDNEYENGGLMNGFCFDNTGISEQKSTVPVSAINNEELISKVFFNLTEPPRWLIFIGENSIVIVDRNKWNEKRYLEFDLDEIFSRREETTFQAMAVLLHRESLCPDEGESLLDKLDENSHKHASGVSQNLKYALRECIELLGNEVLYDMSHRLGRDLDAEPVDAAQLTLECLRYMYRMLFVLFIEARPELGYAPMKAQAYVQGYSLESLRDVADSIREETSTVGEGYFLHESLSKLFELIYNGYPEDPAKLRELQNAESLHDMFILEPLKAHIFDPDFTPMISGAKLRNRVMLRIIDLMSVTRSSGRSNERRGRISYSNLGINQMGAVYEALLSYRGFIAEQTLYEVKRERDEYDELDVGYFVPESELENYTENERARYPDGRLRKYEKGTFIYRLAGREREKSASYYTPEVLTKCLVKYALKELLEGKTADEILQLTVCEPAMGSAAFLNEVINQLAEAYLDRKQKELGHSIPHEKRFDELQRVKMYIADRNVYGIDLNPVAVELAEVSLWLNTIFSGGFVPWFNTHLVCGNSLIGARRQCYDINQLKADRAPAVWYENEPERIVPGGKRNPKKQVYHFLTGDPGMSNYTDRIIQSLAPDDVRQIRNWNRKFTSPFSDGEIKTVLRLSETIDELWEKQIKLRREIDEKTSDPLSIFGQHKTTHTLHTTIREKDMIYRRLYKSEEMNNAGPYARLKFAMDYWCALWFWPIDKAELLPTRSEFLVDMSFILEGTIDTFRTIAPEINSNQLTLFPSEAEQLVVKMSEQYEDLGIVDIPKLCEQQPRLALVREIAKQQRFLHWELEFADLFAERGGFDLIIGNPPWIKMEWNEQAVLSDRNPMFAVKALSAAQTAKHRDEALKDSVTKQLYFSEYESLSSIQSFINATQNYAVLKGQQANLYRCFLPQAWSFGSSTGVSAFLHPDGVYDDPKGGTLREQLYPRLRRHFQFTNELKLFAEVHHNTMFSLNVYCNSTSPTFDTIANLFDPSSIEQCYDDSISGPVPGIKDENDKWNVKGHPERLVRVGKKELAIFAKLFDGNYNWKQARLPVIHAQLLIDVLYCFSKQEKTIGSIREEIYGTVMWDETNAQNDGTILRNVHFPESPIDMIYSGPHIGVANPLFKCSRTVCRLNSDYDNIDLTTVPENYLQRCNYSPACDMSEYMRRIPTTPWGEKYNHRYSISSRKMLSLSGERTLISAITPKNTAFIHGLYGMIRHGRLSEIAGTMASVPFDFYLKIAGKANGRFDIFAGFPVFDDSLYSADISIRLLLLNCLSVFFAELWREELPLKGIFGWSKSDPRLRPERFTSLTPEWTWNTPLRTDYERRQALVEIDVLTAMALGMTLEQLKTIYRIQFPVLRQYESDTWYDANGRIVFTNNRSLTGVGFPRSEFEPIKNASAGQKFYRTVIDDTMPVGPIERTIEYVAPFDRCDREQDYETAWRFFAEKYGVWHD